MSSEGPATYSYRDVADRIEQVLGERPSTSALRAASTKDRHTPDTKSRPRLTVGMPRPLPAPSPTTPAAFAVDEIECWLAAHPRRILNRAAQEAEEATRRGEPVESVVTAALSKGLTWRAITAALNAGDGGRRSTAGVYKRFRRLADSDPPAPTG